MAYLTQFSNSVPVIKFPIDQAVMTVGQDIETDICVPEDGIAANHATIEANKTDDSFRFTVKSREGESLIDLNGKSVSHSELKDGDWLIIGGVEFQFTDDGVNEIAGIVVSINSAEKVKPKETVKSVKEEAKPVSTQDFIEDSRFSRRLNRF